MKKLKFLGILFVILITLFVSFNQTYASDGDSKTNDIIITTSKMSEILNAYIIADDIVKQYYNAEQKCETILFEDIFYMRV